MPRYLIASRDVLDSRCGRLARSRERLEFIEGERRRNRPRHWEHSLREARASDADLDRTVSLAHVNHSGWQLGTPLLDDRALCFPARVVQQHDASRRESILHDRCQTIATTAGRALRAIAHNQADPVGQVRRPRARTRDVVAQLHEMRSRRALGQWPRRLPRTLGSPGACSARGANRLATPRSLRPRPPL
jgi:hypothetical protein